MRVPHTYSVRKLKKQLKRHGILWVAARGKGGHGVFEGPNAAGKIQTFPLPSEPHKKEVAGTYRKALLRRYDLSEKVLNE